MSVEFTKLTETKKQLDTCRTFYGYDAKLKITNGEFSMTENTSSKNYPYLSPKSPSGRVRTLTKPHGLFALNGLAWVDGTKLYYNGQQVSGLTLQDNDKQIIGYGAYIIIWPDKVMYNTHDGTYKYMEQTNTAGDVSIRLCAMDGTAYDTAEPSASEPENPVNGQLWIDISGKAELKIYSQSQGAWSAISTVYCKIEAEGIGAGLAEYDAVNISGITDSTVQDLNGSHVIYAYGDDYIVVIGPCAAWDVISQTASITVKREIPSMDFICQHENRLWGCSSSNHEIYCSALGDPCNFNRFLGLSTDSYAATVGSPGDFTGCIAHGGYVLFFKEDRIHKMYGSYPSSYQLTENVCRGVEAGSSHSLCAVNESLFYKSRADVNAYTSSSPASVSDNLGNVHYKNVWCGKQEGNLYLNMQDDAGNHHFFCYDTTNDIWNRLNDTDARYMSEYQDDMYYIAGNEIWSINGSLPSLYTDSTASLEKPVHWFVETGDLSLDSNTNSYVQPMSNDERYMSRIQVRTDLEQGSFISFALQYDTDKDWHEVYRYSASGKRSMLVPIVPRRADTVRMRIEGVGPCVIYSLSKQVEKAGFRG